MTPNIVVADSDDDAALPDDDDSAAPADEEKKAASAAGRAIAQGDSGAEDQGQLVVGRWPLVVEF